MDDVLLYFAKITDEYNLLTGNNLSSEDMEAELKKLEVNLVDLAGQLASARHDLAQQLEAELNKNFRIYMEAQFQVRFSKSKFSREGNETVEFCFTNPGEDFDHGQGGVWRRIVPPHVGYQVSLSRKEGKTSML